MSTTAKYALIAVGVAIVSAVLVTVIKVYLFGGAGGAIPGGVIGASTGAIYVMLMKKKAGENQ